MAELPKKLNVEYISVFDNYGNYYQKESLIPGKMFYLWGRFVETIDLSVTHVDEGEFVLHVDFTDN